ncbi:MAG: hypothetical protein ACK5M4_13760 [Pseudorhodobacter sp.]
MAEKPTPNPNAIRSLRDYLDDPLNRFVFEVYFRSCSLLDTPSLPRSLIAMEMLQSALSAFDGELSHSDISDAYPVKAWREDTVEVPRAWVRVLVEGWKQYKRAPTGTSCGEAFGIEGGGQGKPPAKHRLSKLKDDIHISNEVLITYLQERAGGGRGSWERACGKVAERREISEETVHRASKILRKQTVDKMERIGVLGGKTSRSDTP